MGWLSSTVRRKPLGAPGPPLAPLPPPQEAPRGFWRLALPVLLLLYLALAGIHARLVPLGATGYQNAPDEAAHMAYVRAVAGGQLPTRDKAAQNPIGYEWHQPPLYYWLAARLLPWGERAVRGFSVLCGLGGLLLIYRAGRLLFPNEPVLAILAAGIAALTPTHIAITSTVNNDPLLEVCFSGTLLVLLGAFLGGFTLWRAGWLGLLLGAALLTKATGLLLLPVVVLALFLLWRAGERPQDLLRGAGWMALLMLAVSGWWFVRNARLYGEPLPLRAFAASFAGTMQAQTVADRLGGWPEYLLFMTWGIFRSFWAVYGTRQDAVLGVPRFLPDQIYGVLGGVSVAGLAGLIRLHLRRRTDFTETQLYFLWILFAAVGVVAISFLAFILQYFQMQGRYLYPAMLPICLLLALGWRGVFPPRYRDLASGMLLALLAAAAAAFLRSVAPL
ncbi:MAG TPA: glycosyltransferase family 39 protein [Chthonomonadaceae bacterium]|nr:glycosyltransferase family 39 protein [Chthonomonadaceae bacterium]